MEYQTESYLLLDPSRHVSFGALDPFVTGTRVVSLASSYAASAGIITSALATGVGIAIAVVVVIYSFITANYKRVRAARKARKARWEGLYQLGVGLITDVYGSIKDFTWSHDHSSDVGFGEYYSLGAKFYWWTGGAGDPTETTEDRRVNLISFLVSYGLEPTRFLGFENVTLDEELDPQRDSIHKAEKKVTAKETLMGFGYTGEQLAAITDEEPLVWIYDSFQIDLPNLSGSDQAQTFMNDMTISIKMLGLDPSIFKSKVSSITSKGFGEADLGPESLTASLSSSGGILMIGIAAATLLGIKKSKRRK